MFLFNMIKSLHNAGCFFLLLLSCVADEKKKVLPTLNVTSTCLCVCVCVCESECVCVHARTFKNVSERVSYTSGLFHLSQDRRLI